MEPRKTNRPLTVCALLLSLFVAAMETTVVSIAMPTVIGELGGIEYYSWVFTVYMLTATVPMPIFGRLSDVHGRKPILLFGITLFLAGSVLSGQSHDMTQLVIFRALQGLGAGAMQTMTFTIVGDIFTLEERGRMQGLLSGIWGFAGIVGPILGAIILKNLSWRWIFYINVPFGIAALAVLIPAFHENIERREHRLDYAGAGLLVCACLAFLFGCHGGTVAYVLIPTGLVLLAIFIVVERKVAEPLLPAEVFGMRVMKVVSIAGALIGGAMFGVLTFIPLFVQAVVHGDSADVGRVLTFMVVGWPIGSVIGGRVLPRVGFRPLIFLGMTLNVCAGVALAFFANPQDGILVPEVVMGLLGLGMGFSNISMILAVQSTVTWEQRGVATASATFFRMMGGMLAVGAMGGILATILTSHSSISAADINRLLGPDHGAHLGGGVTAEIASVLGVALVYIFGIVFCLTVLAFVASLFFPFIPIRRDGENTAQSSTT